MLFLSSLTIAFFILIRKMTLRPLKKLAISLICVLAVMAGVHFSSCKFSGKLNHPEYFDSVFKIAIEIRSTDPQASFRFLDSSYEAFPKPGPLDLYRKYDFMRYAYMYHSKDLSKAGKYVDSMISIIEGLPKSKYTREYALAHLYKGDLLFEEKKYIEAYQYFYKGKTIAQAIEEPYTLTQYHHRLGMVCYRQEKYAEAADHFKRALQISAPLEKNEFNFIYNQELLSNIGLSYESLHQNDSAFTYYKKALDYINANKQSVTDKNVSIALGVLYGNLAQAYLVKGDTTEAEQLLKKSIGINLRKDYDFRDAQYSQIKLANLYIALGRYEEGAEMLEEIKKALETNFIDEIELDRLRLSWILYHKSNQLTKAYSYLNAYIKLKENVENNNKSFSGVDFNREFQKISQQYELNILKKDNDLKTLYLIVVIIFSSMSIAIMLLVWQNWRRSKNNITILTDLNDQLQHTLNALKDSNNEKDRIMHIVAHDLRNSISAISVITDIIVNNETISKDNQDLFDLIKISSSSSLDMIKDLSQIILAPEAQPMVKAETDFTMLVRQCVNMLQFKANEKNQKITFVAPADHIFININKDKIWQAVSNLIVNAIKFSHKKQPITITLADLGDSVQVSVADKGIGIPDEIKDKVFDSFSAAKRPGTTGELAFGLGLSISQSILKAHNGKIWFESTPNKGSTFYIMIPK